MANPGHTYTPQSGPRAGQKVAVDEDTSSTPDPEHVSSLLSGLKGLLGMGGSKKPSISEGGKDVNSAVDEAVRGTPGNTTDY